MTDPAQPSQPTTQPADPLKALEEALKNTGGVAAGEQSAANPTEPPKSDPAVEEAKKREALKVMETQHDQADEQELKAQIANLHQLAKDAPKHVSESATATATAPATSAQAEDKAGFEIHQLDHQKIPGTS